MESRKTAQLLSIILISDKKWARFARALEFFQPPIPKMSFAFVSWKYVRNMPYSSLGATWELQSLVDKSWCANHTDVCFWCFMISSSYIGISIKRQSCWKNSILILTEFLFESLQTFCICVLTLVENGFLVLVASRQNGLSKKEEYAWTAFRNDEACGDTNIAGIWAWY